MAQMRMRLLAVLVFALLSMACEARAVDKYVLIDVDGGQIQQATTATTVAGALDDAGVELAPLDRVQPDMNEPLERSTHIIITRVREELSHEERTLPFPRTLLRDESMADGTSRVLQLGVNGREALTYRTLYENDQEIARELVSQQAVEIPREEIVVVGAKGLLTSVPINGTIIYLSNNNGWLMRDGSGNKRPLTSTGDLDGRVFALSPGGNRLLFTRRASVGGAAGAAGPLNALFQADTQAEGSTGAAVGVEDVLWADWLSDTQIVYSTGERTVGAPGWKAHNDLWRYDLPSRQKVRLLEPLSNIAYAFWGVSFVLAPDRQRIVYASADELGFVDLSSGARSLLQQFPVYQTNAGWVWTPDLTWSPDMRFIAATLHAPPPATPDPELASLFDVWAINTDGSFAAPLAPDVGMFASPVWSRQRSIAYAQARHPRESADDQYDLFVMDADGSNKRRIFPLNGEHGLTNPQFAWSSNGEKVLAVQDGNLFMVDVNGKSAAQLSADGGAVQVQWR